MKKKLIVLVSVILFVGVIYLILRIAGYYVPLKAFKKETQKFDQYVTEIKEDTSDKKRKRLEMSVEEYNRLKEDMLTESR